MDTNFIPTTDWHNWCRLCAKDDLKHGNYTIDKNLNDVDIERIISYELRINLSNKQLPQLICSECYTLLSTWESFSKRAITIQDMFTKLYEDEINTNAVNNEYFDNNNKKYTNHSKKAIKIKPEHTLVSKKTEYSMDCDDNTLFLDTISNSESQLNNLSEKLEQNTQTQLNNTTAGWTQQIKKRPGQYKSYTQAERQAIVEEARNNGDWAKLAAKLGINYKTAFSWIKSGRFNYLTKGAKLQQLNDNETKMIIKWIEEEQNITISEVLIRLKHQIDKDICRTTVINHLEGQLFSFRNIESKSNSNITNAHQILITSLRNYINMGKQILYIDDMNFTLFCRHIQSRAYIERTIRGPNIHILAAIHTNGIFSMARGRNTFIPETVNKWMSSVLKKWNDRGNQYKDLVIVCCNELYGKTLEAEILKKTNGKVKVLLLGKSSQMLNPVMLVWSKMKSYLMEKENYNPLAIARGKCPGVFADDLVKLESAIDRAKCIITKEDCERGIHMNKQFLNDIDDKLILTT